VHGVFVPILFNLLSDVVALTTYDSIPCFFLFYPPYLVASIAAARLLHYSIEKLFLLLHARQRPRNAAAATAEPPSLPDRAPRNAGSE
jgi:hypothetical protein